MANPLVNSRPEMEIREMSSMISMRRPALVLGLAVCVGWCLGCGAGQPPTGKLAGKVTLQGKPLASGTVTLVNTDSGIGASSQLDASGGYRIDSVRTGEYQVAIQPPPAPSPEAMAEGAKMEPSAIPDKYQDPQASGLKVTVGKGDNTSDFDLQ